jgi:HEAT repeat protein
MGRRKIMSLRIPRPFGREVLDAKSLDEVVEDLAVEHRARAAMWRLVEARGAAIPAVRRGLSHESPRVREGCCEVLDHYWDEDSIPDLVARLDDEDPRVRWMAAHAVECLRCKKPSRTTR